MPAVLELGVLVTWQARAEDKPGNLLRFAGKHANSRSCAHLVGAALDALLARGVLRQGDCAQPRAPPHAVVGLHKLLMLEALLCAAGILRPRRALWGLTCKVLRATTQCKESKCGSGMRCITP